MIRYSTKYFFKLDVCGTKRHVQESNIKKELGGLSSCIKCGKTGRIIMCGECNRWTMTENKPIPFMYMIKCPNGHKTTKYNTTFRDEIKNEDISIFYCWKCKKGFRFT